MKITPQNGMPVLFHVGAGDALFAFGIGLAAIITHVWGPAMVNLAIFDANGLVHNRSSVMLHQGDDGQPNPVGGRWCEFPSWFLQLHGATLQNAGLRAFIEGMPREYSFLREVPGASARGFFLPGQGDDRPPLVPTSQVTG